jgi:hypothetical protein
MSHPVVLQMTLDGAKNIRIALEGHGNQSCSNAPWHPGFRFTIGGDDAMPSVLGLVRTGWVETSPPSISVQCYILSQKSYYYEYAEVRWWGKLTTEELEQLDICHVDAIRRGLNLVEEELDRRSP